MKQKSFIPLNFSMWDISKEELEHILNDANLSIEEKQAILDEYEEAGS